jgi:hypothetical protein
MNYYYESDDGWQSTDKCHCFEYEDKLRFRRLVGAPQSISIDEMYALTRYAGKGTLEITPLVQGLGHATFILKHQEYEAKGMSGIHGHFVPCTKELTRYCLTSTGMQLMLLLVQNTCILAEMR